MMKCANTYVKTDDNRIINEIQIKWAAKVKDCFEICVRADGCRIGRNTHKLCMLNNLDNYNKMNAHFEKPDKSVLDNCHVHTFPIVCFVIIFILSVFMLIR